MKKVQRIICGVITLAVAFGLSASGCVAQSGDKSVQGSNPRTAATVQSNDLKAIDFDFTDFNGKARKFSEFRGKIVLLDFWATWCAPCLADIPKLKSIYEKHKADGFEIVGMNVETIGDDDAPDASTLKESAGHASQIVASRSVNWTIATSGTAVPVATKIFGVESLPTKILIDRDGNVFAAVGEKDDLAEIVERLLSERK